MACKTAFFYRVNPLKKASLILCFPFLIASSCNTKTAEPEEEKMEETTASPEIV